MSKYHPIQNKKINKTKGRLMKICAKIKCFFGFCKELKKIELQEKEAIEGVYKVEPKVQTLDIKEDFGNKVDETLNVKVIDTSKITATGVTKNTSKKVEKIKKVKAAVTKTREKQKAEKAEVSKPTKVKRHWYNNSKTQKLIPVGEETSLPKTWKKGKLKAPKKDK